MTDERWREVWEIFEAASAVPPDQRGTFLESASSDPEVLRKVLTMLEEPALPTSSPVPASRIGKRIGRYVVTGELGRGGIGEVYCARDTELGRTVALKFLAPASLGLHSAVQRFIREAKAASALNHPNIVTVYEVIQSDTELAIAMELVDGTVLRTLCGTAHPIDQVVHFGQQIAEALAAAHAGGIVHRDLKPENIMVRRDGYIKVLDFGLARQVAADDQSSTAGLPVGTLRYMSPEQAQAQPPMAASDVFSCAIVLYELCTGRHPFAAESAFETLHAISTKEPEPPSALNALIPRRLELLILAMLAKDARLRPSAEEVALTLAGMARLPVAGVEAPAMLAGMMAARTASETSTGLPPELPARRRWLAAVTGAAMTVALIGWFARPRAPREAASLDAVPFTSGPGEQLDPSFSPDGKQVAYVWNGPHEDNFDVYVRPVSGGRPTQLTSNPEADYSPAWSPDGRSIAFLREVAYERAEVWVVPAVGGTGQKLAELNTPPRGPWWYPGPSMRWSPDGNWLVVSTHERPMESYALFLLSLSTGELRRLTTPPARGRPFGDTSPAFSPDGRTLAFTRVVAYGSIDLYVLALSKELQPTGPPKRIETGRPWNASAVWTPDGREIVFSTGIVDNTHLGRISAWKPERTRILVGAGESGWYPAIAPVRSAAGEAVLIYTKHFQKLSLWRINLVHDDRGFPSMHAPPIRLIASSNSNIHPNYSSDGRRIAFISDRTGYHEVWVSDSDGGNAAQWTDLRWPAVEVPRWSPDGRRITFTAQRGGNSDVYVIDAPGAAPRRLTDNPSLDENSTWSRDGRWIYFTSYRTGDQRIWKIPAAGGEASQITGQTASSAWISPDGGTLYFKGRHEGDESVWSMPAEGGPAKRLVRNAGSFAVGKRGIYFVPLRPLPGSPKSSFAYFDFASATSVPWAKAERPLWYVIDVSPDERSLLYSQVDFQATDLMKVERFR